MKKILVIILVATLANSANAAISFSANSAAVGHDTTATVDVVSSDNSPWCGFIEFPSCTGVEVVDITPLPAAGSFADAYIGEGYIDLCAQGLPPSTITPGSQFRITFASTGTGSCDFDLSLDYEWPTVSDTVTVSQAVTVISPNGGEVIAAGSVYPIDWQFASQHYFWGMIWYSTNNGADWTMIGSETNEIPFYWQVPMVQSDRDQCLIRIVVEGFNGSENVSEEDLSDSTFTIYQCQLNSAADLNNDCKVNIHDLAIISAGWSDVYDLNDLTILVDDWLRNGNPFDPFFTEAP